MKILAEHVAQQLEERAFCVVFEGDLDRCWPSSGMSQAELERRIQDFAESQGVDCRNSRGWVRCESNIFESLNLVSRGVDLISHALPFGRLWYEDPSAVSYVICYAKFRSRSHDAVIRVYDEVGNVERIIPFDDASRKL